jgi:hypothetical protein
VDRPRNSDAPVQIFTLVLDWRVVSTKSGDSGRDFFLYHLIVLCGLKVGVTLVF